MTRSITPVRPEAARGLVADVYRQIKRDFGAIVDPFAVHSVSPPLLAAVWSACRESQLVGVVPREIKEAVAVTVSMANQCPFCTDAHVVMLHAMKAHSVARALLCGDADNLSQEVHRAVAWARATGGESADAVPVPYSAAEAPEMIGTAVFYHYMNRMCTILLADTPLPSSQRWLKGFLSRSAGWYFSFAARREKTAGGSLSFLPDAELPEDFAWASDNEHLAGAWARFAAEIERQGASTLRSETRVFATEYLESAADATFARDAKSIADALRPVDSRQRAAARLVLLTMTMPHVVDAAVIGEFADPAREPATVLGALAWASFTAARRIGARLRLQIVQVPTEVGISG